ncbi:MAG: hypothetical protein JSS49_20315 [Planctomycetes bacterium]|nr:hypothetical protein [Planctomycetota bacterium]
MKRNANRGWRGLLLTGCLVLSALNAGCWQTTISGQTLPSAYYLDDDVQYFPSGPEQKLANQIRAMEKYKLQQQGMEDDAQSDYGK